jgi:hypothetical protein
MSDSAEQPDPTPDEAAIREGRVPWVVQRPDEIRQEDTEDIRFIKRCAFWKYWIDCLLVRKTTRLVIFGFFVAILGGIFDSAFLTLFAFGIFLVLGLGFVLSSILEILPFTRFSLGGLFLAVFCLQIPFVMIFSSNSPELCALGSLLFLIWLYIVFSRIHIGIISAREDKERKARRLKEEAESKTTA